jgi:hypothetical protein
MLFSCIGQPSTGQAHGERFHQSKVGKIGMKVNWAGDVRLPTPTQPGWRKFARLD